MSHKNYRRNDKLTDYSKTRKYCWTRRFNRKPWREQSMGWLKEFKRAYNRAQRRQPVPDHEGIVDYRQWKNVDKWSYD